MTLNKARAVMACAAEDREWKGKEMTLETNRIIVAAVSEAGAVVAINGENRKITWPDLVIAARRPEFVPGVTHDEELIGIYRSILREARQLVERNKHLPLLYSVERNSTNVRWIARIRDVSGASGWIPCAADEGGSHMRYEDALREVEYRAAGLRRAGYVVIEEPNTPSWV